MALLLPFLLALMGGAVDLARAYQAQVTLQSATRNAAEFVASTSDELTAEADARRVLCLEMRQAPGFQTGAGGDEECDSPTVSVTFALSETDPGASVENPIGTAAVSATAGFQTVIPWPLLPHSFTISAEATFSVIQGRNAG
jgi:Flp pilus assembly protein TadG